MKIFAFYIGGRTRTSMIELHDVRIIAAETLEDCYPRLRHGWWGTSESLHLDCWGEVKAADGHQVALRPEPFAGDNKLWFFNLGGYMPGEFHELHYNVFIVAPTEMKARFRALDHVGHWRDAHKDRQFEVENLVCVSDMFTPERLYIHLTPAPGSTFQFEYGLNADVRKK